ncbi:MAG: outer membrane protein multidrug efflux system [Desulfuromonadales bacterium]|nr:outer membrane protein multidrug efflux system [Desulfuromonadales bacterium]
MKTKPSLLALVLLAGLGLTACVAVGPDYETPVMDVPAAWRQSGLKADGEKQVAEAIDLSRWWRELDDPVLNDLVTDALKANLDLATARAQLREARAQRALAGAQLGPTVDVSTSATRRQSSEKSGSGATSELYNAGFDADWEVDIFGGLRRGLEAAEADLDAGMEGLRDTQVSIVAEVVLNYVDLRTAERRLTIAEDNIASLNEIFELARWRFQAGLVSEIDVAAARTELESTRADLPSLRTTTVEARNRLAVLLGRKPGDLESRLSVSGAIPLAEHAVAVGIPADILRQRPDVRAAERKLAAQTARLGEAEADRYPSFNLSGSVGLEALTLSGLGSGSAALYSLLGSMTAPIFHSGRILANIETQDALLEQARLAYKTAVLTALEDVENALVAVTNTSERRNKLMQAADSARETLRLAEQRYASGLIDFLTVLDSQRTVLNLEDDLAGSTGELAAAQIQLYKALGGGWSVAPEQENHRNAS